MAAEQARVDPAIFDARVLGVVQHLLPPERLQAYLEDLDRQFGVLVEITADDLALYREAHNIVSQAGMLGLTRMAECARQVEDACRSGAGPAAALLQCRKAIADVRDYAIPAAGFADAGDPAAVGQQLRSPPVRSEKL
jgi:HPt (histidine-containing phosphotransfer) domain-containing protein